MRNFIYFIMIAWISCSFISCNDKDNSSDITGNWNYEKPHFEFEYASDSVSIVMMKGQKKNWAVKDLKAAFLRMANEKMGDYFKGLTILPDNQLSIRMVYQSGQEDSLRAEYKQSADILQITLNKDDLAELAGAAAAMIPPVSFNYSLHGNKMTVYFDKAYVSVLYSMMGDKIIPIIVSMMGIDISQLPEAAQKAIINDIKKQISGILENTRKLEIGFVVGRTK